MREYRTEAAGWRATWRRRPDRITILAIAGTDSPTALFTASEATAPDLADMRERMPELSALWDAIRREYWTALGQTGPAASS